MWLNVYADVQVACGTAPEAVLAFTPHSKHLAVVYACGNADGYALGTVYPAFALTVRTGFFYYLAGAAAGIAGADSGKRAKHGVLLRAHLTAAAADGTGCGLCARLCAAAAAGRTVFLTGYKYFLLAAECGFLKGYGKVIAQVVARNGAIAPLRTAAKAAKPTETASGKGREYVLKAPKTTPTETTAGLSRIKGRMAKLIVLGPFLGV